MLTADVRIPDSLIKHLQDLGKIKGNVKIGIFEGATYAQTDESGADIPVAYVAYLNEYGGLHNPERPFFRRTVENCAKKWTNGWAHSVKEKGYTQESVNHAFELVGMVGAGDVKKTITKWPTDDPRPNQPSTIARKEARMYGNTQKGGNLKAIDPNSVLIDTATMITAITYEVEK